MLKYLVLGIACFIASASHAQTFEGYDCTQDCSGHEAGYDWAQQRGITDESDCGGNSNSFIEGCRAYAEQNDTSASDEESSDQIDGQANEDEESEE
jgi:hypothetical protein